MMTKDEINSRLATEVMGWHEETTPHLFTWAPGHTSYDKGPWWADDKGVHFRLKDWNPAERIDHAWMVVEKFLFVTLNGAPGRYTCRLISQYDDMGNGMWGTATTENAPMAICLAALKAKEGENE